MTYQIFGVAIAAAKYDLRKGKFRVWCDCGISHFRAESKEAAQTVADEEAKRIFPSRHGFTGHFANVTAVPDAMVIERARALGMATAEEVEVLKAEIKRLKAKKRQRDRWVDDEEEAA